jgi:hypothetical protein
MLKGENAHRAAGSRVMRYVEQDAEVKGATLPQNVPILHRPKTAGILDFLSRITRSGNVHIG